MSRIWLDPILKLETVYILAVACLNLFCNISGLFILSTVCLDDVSMLAGLCMFVWKMSELFLSLFGCLSVFNLSRVCPNPPWNLSGLCLVPSKSKICLDSVWILSKLYVEPFFTLPIICFKCVLNMSALCLDPLFADVTVFILGE